MSRNAHRVLHEHHGESRKVWLKQEALDWALREEWELPGRQEGGSAFQPEALGNGEERESGKVIGKALHL